MGEMTLTMPARVLRIRSRKRSEIFISNMEICRFGQVRKKLSSSKNIEWFGNEGMAQTQWQLKKRDLLVSMQNHLVENRTTRCLKTSFRSVVMISEIKTIYSFQCFWLVDSLVLSINVKLDSTQNSPRIGQSKPYIKIS